MPPHIYTIAPDRAFLATLAQGLLALAGGDPLMLPRMTVLLPTRRAARALRKPVAHPAEAGHLYCWALRRTSGGRSAAGP